MCIGLMLKNHTFVHWFSFQQPHDKTNKMTCAPSEDSDQPRHPPSLTRVFAVHMKTAWVLSYPLSAQRRLWSDWADAQADLSLRWAHMPFCWFRHEAAQNFVISVAQNLMLGDDGTVLAELDMVLTQDQFFTLYEQPSNEEWVHLHFWNIINT